MILPVRFAFSPKAATVYATPGSTSTAALITGPTPGAEATIPSGSASA